MRPGGLASVLAAGALTACATGAASHPAQALAVSSVPSPECVRLGTIVVREATEVLVPPDLLAATAIEHVRVRAAERGATHVIVTEQPMTAMVSYTTTARAAGLAFRCAPPSWNPE